MRLDEFASWGQTERRWADSTTGHYVRRVRVCDQWLRHHGHPRGVMRATDDQLRDWWDTLPATPASRNLARKALHAYGCWMVSIDYRVDCPARGLPSWRTPRGVPRPLPSGQAASLARQVGADPDVGTVGVAVMLWAGLRIGEAVRLRWSDWDGDWLTVRGKGGVVRRVPTPPRLVRVLQVWRAASGGEGWMLPGLRGHVHESTLRRLVIDLTDATPHRLRHTYATELLGRSHDLRLVQEALGHASPATTAIYTRVSPQRLAAAAAGLYRG